MFVVNEIDLRFKFKSLRLIVILKILYRMNNLWFLTLFIICIKVWVYFPAKLCATDWQLLLKSTPCNHCSVST